MSVIDRLPKFKNIKNKFREMSLDLEQNKIDINENDALADKTFFAFLADLLKCFKKDKHSDLMDELKENENLTRERLEKLIKVELENNESLSKEQKEKIGKIIDADKDCIDIIGDKFKEVNDFIKKAKEIGIDKESIANKLKEISFSAKDIQKITASNSDSTIKDTAKNVVKQVVRLATK